MQASSFSGILEPIYQTTRRHFPEYLQVSLIVGENHIPGTFTDILGFCRQGLEAAVHIFASMENSPVKDENQPVIRCCHILESFFFTSLCKFLQSF
jgi:hypothetical protein